MAQVTDPYTLEAFQKKYQLPETEAERLFRNFGPEKINLDILMRGKLERARLQFDVGKTR